MKTPIIIVNFKAYESAVGARALALAQACERVAQETGASVAVALQAADLFRVSQRVSIPVFAQHIDPVTFGSETGRVLPEGVKEAGAAGTLLNHSECRLRLDVLQQSILRAKEAGLDTVVCANNPSSGAAIAAFAPDFVAVEPPELIGKMSVAQAKPEVISDSVALIRKVNPHQKILVGAGIQTEEDVRVSLRLGADGVLLASGVTKAEHPEDVVRALAQGLRKNY